MKKTTINIQPTWLSMLPSMLVLNTQFDNQIKRKSSTEQDDKNRNEVREQFKQMAIAADNWNKHCEQVKSQPMENLISSISEQMTSLVLRIQTATKDDKINLAVLTDCLRNLKY